MAHIVTSFDAELQKLSSTISEMGASVVAQLMNAANALRARDAAMAQSVRDADAGVDLMQQRIEERVIAVLIKRQPMAVDLRETIATLKIAADLERIGDLAKNNTKRLIALKELAQPASVTTSLDQLSRRVHEQVSQVMLAYSRRDSDLARKVWESDSDVDNLHTALFRELLTYMMEDPRSIGYCTHLLFCAKNLERAGDHATNIAETVHYLVQGAHLDGDRPKGDDASTYVTAPAS